MDGFLLTLNAGSSSLKFCVYRNKPSAAQELQARGQIEGIGVAPRLTVKGPSGETLDDQQLASTVSDARRAFDELVLWLRARFGGAKILGVGHRVVHGGPAHAEPTSVTRKLLDELHNLIPLAPLHQPFNLAPIEAILERLPDVPQVACFDTAFHRGQPAVAELVPLPRELCEGRIQRYGFHGISYEYIASALPEIAPSIARGRVIVAHLGSGASLCALKDGRSIDSTLGFTALDGLCMGTRPGSVDPGVILYLFQTLGMTPLQVESTLYKKSGLLGISGMSNDMRVLLSSSEPAARLAVDYFVYRAAKEMGSMAAALGGVDGIVFTAGIGENSPEIRRRICEASAWLGIDFDAAANTQKGPRISKESSKVSAWVIHTNEELMIARHTTRLLGLA